MAWSLELEIFLPQLQPASFLFSVHYNRGGERLTFQREGLAFRMHCFRTQAASSLYQPLLLPREAEWNKDLRGSTAAELKGGWE